MTTATRVAVVESTTGMRHLVEPLGPSWWTFCAVRVPRARGWFGPVDRPATCSRCLRHQARRGEHR